MITEDYLGKSGVLYTFEYVQLDSLSNLDMSLVRQCYGVCFYKEKIVIVHNGKKDTWGLVGGTVEKGEHPDETLEREIQEESNMEVLDFKLLGVQKVTDSRDDTFVYQLRYVCSVRPYGPFVSDPDDSIDKIEIIKPEDYRQYFNWGEIGEEIINKAIEIWPELKT